MKRAPIFLLIIMILFSCKKNNTEDTSFSHALSVVGLKFDSSYNYILNHLGATDSGSFIIYEDTSVRETKGTWTKRIKCIYSYSGDKNIYCNGNKAFFYLKVINQSDCNGNGYITSGEATYFYNGGCMFDTFQNLNYQFYK